MVELRILSLSRAITSCEESKEVQHPYENAPLSECDLESVKRKLATTFQLQRCLTSLRNGLQYENRIYACMTAVTGI